MLKDSAKNGGLKELGVKASEIVGWRPGRPTEGPKSSTWGYFVIHHLLHTN